MSFREFFHFMGSGSTAPREVRRIRREQSRRQETQTETGGTEHFHSITQVQDFLSKKRPNVEPHLSRNLPQQPSREEVSKNFLQRKSERIEPLLLDALEVAKQEGSKQNADHLRGLVRAASWFMHQRPEEASLQETAKKALRATMRKKLAALETHQTHLSRQSLEDDAHDLEDERKELALVVDALEGTSVGPAVLPAVEAIEALVGQAWSKLQAAEAVAYPKKDLVKHPHVQEARRHLEELQRLRDALYFSYLYPIWTKRNREL